MNAIVHHGQQPDIVLLAMCDHGLHFVAEALLGRRLRQVVQFADAFYATGFEIYLIVLALLYVICTSLPSR